MTTSAAVMAPSLEPTGWTPTTSSRPMARRSRARAGARLHGVRAALPVPARRLTAVRAIGLFIASGKPNLPGLGVALLALMAAAFLGNVSGYELGRVIGDRVYDRDGRLVKRHRMVVSGALISVCAATEFDDQFYRGHGPFGSGRLACLMRWRFRFFGRRGIVRLLVGAWHVVPGFLFPCTASVCGGGGGRQSVERERSVVRWWLGAIRSAPTRRGFP